MEALTSVMENLAIYSEQTKDAKKLGADIIVFPEVIFAWFIWLENSSPSCRILPWILQFTCLNCRPLWQLCAAMMSWVRQWIELVDTNRFSANKIKSSESVNKQPTQFIVELNSSLRHIIVTHDSTDLKNCSGILASNSKYLDCYFQYLVELFWYLVKKKE